MQSRGGDHGHQHDGGPILDRRRARIKPSADGSKMGPPRTYGPRAPIRRAFLARPSCRVRPGSTQVDPTRPISPPFAIAWSGHSQHLRRRELARHHGQRLVSDLRRHAEQLRWDYFAASKLAQTPEQSEIARRRLSPSQGGAFQKAVVIFSASRASRLRRSSIGQQHAARLRSSIPLHLFRPPRAAALGQKGLHDAGLPFAGAVSR